MSAYEAVLAELARVREAEGDDQYVGAMALAAAVEVLMEEWDPIETGREAALGQWEARWEALRRTGRWFIDRIGPRHMVTVQSVMTEMDQIEAAIPTGLAVGERWVPRYAGRVNIQLEPERLDRLIELLPLGLHQGDSVEARDMYDADALAEDITNMKDRP